MGDKTDKLVDVLSSDISPRDLKVIFGKGGLLFWRVLMTALWLWAFGFIAIFGGGFAHSNDVKEMRIEQLAESIEQNRVRQCTAMTAEARQFYGVKVSELRIKYRNQSGQDYQLIDCSDLR